MTKRSPEKENPLTAAILAEEANQGAVGVAALPNQRWLRFFEQLAKRDLYP